MNLTINEIKSEIKLPVLTIPSGHKIKFWDLILDVVYKIDIQEKFNSLREWTRLKIMTLVVSNWLSFRKLDLKDVRCYTTQRNSWKVSLKPKHDIITLWWEIIDTAVNAWWVSFLTPLYKATKIVRWIIQPSHPNDITKFSANLKQAWKPIWKINTENKKCNSFCKPPKSFNKIDTSNTFWKPVILLDSNIEINPWVTGTIHFRQNIPIEELNRDNAKDTYLTVHSKVMEILESWENQQLEEQKDIIRIWNVSFENLESFLSK
jgi:hypothetical protein